MFNSIKPLNAHLSHAFKNVARGKYYWRYDGKLQYLLSPLFAPTGIIPVVAGSLFSVIFAGSPRTRCLVGCLAIWLGSESFTVCHGTS